MFGNEEGLELLKNSGSTASIIFLERSRGNGHR